ncbi:MAG: hypothetical protein O2954_08385 [bacterium]|nr:hypothetical protein [bacterium]
MLASVQGTGVALPNLAFALIMKSVQQRPSVPQSPATKIAQPATPSADSQHHIDVKV